MAGVARVGTDSGPGGAYCALCKTHIFSYINAAVAAIAAIAVMWTVSAQPKAVCIAIAVGVNALMVYDLEMSKGSKPLAQMHTGGDRIDIHPRLH